MIVWANVVGSLPSVITLGEQACTFNFISDKQVIVVSTFECVIWKYAEILTT